jgi:hypothetical protein
MAEEEQLDLVGPIDSTLAQAQPHDELEHQIKGVLRHLVPLGRVGPQPQRSVPVPSGQPSATGHDRVARATEVLARQRTAVSHSKARRRGAIEIPGRARPIGISTLLRGRLTAPCPCGNQAERLGVMDPPDDVHAHLQLLVRSRW